MKKRFYILLLISFLLSLADVQAQQKATPKAGEGISTFLLRHNRAPKKYYDDFVELNKAKLGKGNVLKLGVTYTIPPVKRSTAADKETPARKQSSKASKIGTTLHEPLFGKQLANVKVTSNQLAGACFYVVSGHGGPALAPSIVAIVIAPFIISFILPVPDASLVVVDICSLTFAAGIIFSAIDTP